MSQGPGLHKHCIYAVDTSHWQLLFITAHHLSYSYWTNTDGETGIVSCDEETMPDSLWTSVKLRLTL